MPYIIPAERAELDPLIDALVHRIKTLPSKHFDPAERASDDGLLDFAGRLNYVCTQIALKLIAPYKSYWAIALISGVFVNIHSEFYRRYAVPYEDNKIERNGDVLYDI